jgi:hypothetical protein
MMDPFDSNPRPEEFPIGSPESRAAARLLVEKRNLVPVICVWIQHLGSGGNPKPQYFACDPQLVDSDWQTWLTPQELETKKREYEEYAAAQREDENPPEPTQAPDVVSPDVPPVPRQEKSSAAATSQKQKSEPESELDTSEKRVSRFIEERTRRPLIRGRRVWHPRP